MKITKIDVKVSDLRLRTSILSLVDKKEYLIDISRIRRQMNLRKLYKKEEWEKHASNREAVIKERTKNWPKPVSSKYLIDYVHKTHDVYAHILAIEDIFADELLAKYKKDWTTFYTVIYCSIMFNMIENRDMGYPRSFLFLNENLKIGIPPYEGTLNSYISVTPDTTLENVKKQFYIYKDHINQKDTISNLDRNREWYWLNMSTKFGGKGLSYSKIYELITGNGEKISYSGMEKAIQSYKKLTTEV